jgi:uncharacterized protein YaaN involved in tellurite resistance
MKETDPSVGTSAERYALIENRAYSDLDAEEQQKVAAIQNEIDIMNPEMTAYYGVGVQKNVASFADEVMKQVKNKDTGAVGEMLADLMQAIKSVGVDGFKDEKPGLFTRLFRGIHSAFERLVLRYEKISGQLDRLADDLSETTRELVRDMQVLDALFGKNLEHFEGLNLYIIAGEKKLEEDFKRTIEDLERAANDSGELVDAQKLNDYRNLVQRFEKRVHDLKLTRTVVLQTIPQIRLAQNNDNELVNKIQSSILNTIPLWKNHLLIAFSLYRQKAASKLQKTISDTTNELLAKNAELLRENAVEIAKESERGIVDVETLRKVNAELISTMEETLQIQAEGRRKRVEVESELKVIEKDLVEALIEAKQQGAQLTGG